MTARQKQGIAAVIEFLVLFVFWLILSGKYEWKYIIIGIFAAGLVTIMTSDFLYSGKNDIYSQQGNLFYVISCLWCWCAYIPWLVKEIVLASVHVAALVLNPKMPINPTLVRFKTQMKQEISLVTLANSITLTPGTITVDLKHNTYLVHALDPDSAGSLESGAMQNRIAHVFGEKSEPPPDMIWMSRSGELE
jgi:multicomponent Na+:H+ antiporter subunit E